MTSTDRATTAARAATAPLRRALDDLVSVFLAELDDHPDRLGALQEQLSADLGDLDVDVDALSGVLDAARDQGRGSAGGTPQRVPPIADAILDGVVDEIHDRTRKRLAETAATLAGADLDAETAAALVDRVGRDATSAAEWAAARSVNRGVVEGADTAQLVFMPEREACLWCTSFAGAVAAKGRPFVPVMAAGSRASDPVPYPPVHRWCRCTVSRYVPEVGPSDVAAVLRREARRSVARGLSAYDSRRARLAATSALLADDPDLPKSVKAAARKSVKAGAYPDEPSRPTARRPVDDPAGDPEPDQGVTAIPEDRPQPPDVGRRPPAALTDDELDQAMQDAIVAEDYELLETLSVEADQRDGEKQTTDAAVEAFARDSTDDDWAESWGLAEDVADDVDPDEIRKLDDMAALLDEGVDEARAYSIVYGVSEDRAARDQAIRQLRSASYEGDGFDALARQAYTDLVNEAYCRAEQDTRGSLLNREALQVNARAATREEPGIDPQELFSGPLTRAEKYASDELKDWWEANGRVTFAEFTESLLGRDGRAAGSGRSIRR